MLTGNIDFACDYIEKHFEGVTVSKPQGTYMLFVDCTDWCKAHGKTIGQLEKAGWTNTYSTASGCKSHFP